MIDFSASLIKRTIVMTHYINKDTPAISDERTRITRVNHLYKLHFKDAVFDVIPILTGTQIFTDLGITRTAADIQQQALGNVPPSLHVDSAHLTTAASDYLLDKLIAFIAAKNWY